MSHLDASKTASERDKRDREKETRVAREEEEKRKDGLRGGIGYRN